MTYEVRNLIDSLNENGIHVIANKQFDAFAFDFSEHDKKVAEEKDKRIEELEKQIGGYRERNILLRQRCKGEAVEFFDRNMFGSLIISSPPLEDSKRISELEDRHQSDCIRINQLLTTIDVLTERYQKLREVHGV